MIETDDKTGKFVKASSVFVPLYTKKIGENVVVKKLSDSLKEPKVDEVLGKLDKELSLKPLAKNHKDTSADNWVADLGREYAQTEIFISNVGAVRVPLAADTPSLHFLKTSSSQNMLGSTTTSL